VTRDFWRESADFEGSFKILSALGVPVARLGASNGTYDIRIVPRNGDPLFSGNAVATLKAGITSLHVDANLSSIRPGRYVLQLRRAGSDWNSYPLHIK